jgi:CRP-like cAMP-binding protein
MSSPENPIRSQLSLSDLGEIGLFGGLSDEVLRDFVAGLRETTPNTGDMIFREGDDAREMYVILAGEIEVLKRSKRGTEARVALLGGGDWFGEMSILDVQRRSASVRAVAPCRLLVVTTRDLDSLYRKDIKSYAMIVLNVARELSRRLRIADGLLADFVVRIFDEYVTAGRP